VISKPFSFFFPMMQTCALTGKPFEITAEDLVFYEKMGVLPPTLCPEERARRRMAWSNQRNLYHRTCDGTGKKIISNISSDKPLKVYDVNFWYSDKWDQLGSGRDFDFSRPFFEQFGELLLQAPIRASFGLQDLMKIVNIPIMRGRIKIAISFLTLTSAMMFTILNR